MTGKIALVTGCAGRLGPVWMQALREAGATVIGVDRQLDGTDVSDLDSVRRLSQRLRDAGQIVSILVNNAGVDSRPGAGDAEAMYVDMVRTNLLGTDYMTRAFHDHLAETSGVVINIASLYGLVAPDLRYYDHRPDGWVKDPIYGATKAGVLSLTRYYAAAYAKDGIRVNALAPGGVVAEGDGLTAQDAQFTAKYTARIPLGRMCRPGDLSGPLLFLASDDSSFVTGQCVALDGGYLVW